MGTTAEAEVPLEEQKESPDQSRAFQPPTHSSQQLWEPHVVPLMQAPPSICGSQPASLSFPFLALS